MLEGSIFYHFCSAIAGWFSGQFQNSRLISGFLRSSDHVAGSEGTVFYKIFMLFRNAWSKIFYALRLDRIFAHSIFQMAFLWSILTAVVAPILPTMMVFVAVVAGFGSLMLAFAYDKKKKLKYFAINKYIYFYAAAYFFATLTSVTVAGSLMGSLLSICFMLFSIVLMNAIETRKQLNVLMFLLVCAGVLVAMYGFYQFLNPAKYSGVWHDKDMFETISFRVYATLENPNVLGEYFLLIIPLAFACCINSKYWIGKLFYLGCCGIMMLCLILTYSRGCYIGILVAIAAFLVLMDRRFIFLGILGLLALPFILPPTIIERFLSIGDMADSSTSYRVYIYMGTIAMLKDYWLCGIGPGTDAFNLVYPAYAYNGISAPHSHNLYLQVICDAGIAGIFIFICVIYQFFKATCGALSREKDFKNRVWMISAITAIGGFLVQSLFDYTFYNYRVMLLFWIVLALGMLFTRLPELKEEGDM